MELPVELQWILGKIFERISGGIPGGAPRNCWRNSEKNLGGIIWSTLKEFPEKIWRNSWRNSWGGFPGRCLQRIVWRKSLEIFLVPILREILKGNLQINFLKKKTSEEFLKKIHWSIYQYLNIIPGGVLGGSLEGFQKELWRIFGGIPRVSRRNSGRFPGGNLGEFAERLQKNS